MSKQRNKTSNRESIQGEQQILCLETDLLQESAASPRITASPKSRLTTECVSNPKKEQVQEKVFPKYTSNSNHYKFKTKSRQVMNPQSQCLTILELFLN